MERNACSLLLGLTVALAAASAAWADAEGDYRMLFGAEDTKVSASKSTIDDAAFAKKLLAAGKALNDSPKLQRMVYEKALAFALKHRGGYQTAAEALALLEKAFPDQAARWAEKKFELAELQYRTSYGAARKEAAKTYLAAMIARAESLAAAGKTEDALALYAKAFPIATYVRSDQTKQIIARRRELAEQIAAERKREAKLKALQAAVAKNSEDTKAREALIRYHLVETGDLAAATKLLTPDVDESLRTYIPLAAKPLAKLPEAACAELGHWYKSLAEQADGQAETRMLLRAEACYGRFQALHTKQDAAGLKVRIALAAVEKGLARAPAATGRPGTSPRQGWTELLGKVDPVRDAVAGRWTNKGGSLAVAMAADARIMVPAAPGPDYELLVSLTRTGQPNAVCILLPLGSGNQCRLSLGGKKGSSLYSGDRKFAAVPTNPVVPKRRHLVRVTVTRPSVGQCTIAAWVDGKELVSWQGASGNLELGGWWKLPRKDCLGLGAWWTDVTFHSVRVRKLKSTTGTSTAPAVSVDLGTSSATATIARYRNRSGREDVKEAENLARLIGRGEVELSDGKTGLDLVACYDAMKLPSRTGKLLRVARSYAVAARTGDTKGLLVEGPNADFGTGRYLAVYRMCTLERLTGKEFCVMDVSIAGKPFHSVVVQSGPFESGRWGVSVLPFQLRKPRTLEIRIWGKGYLMAVDRLYVFKVTKPGN